MTPYMSFMLGPFIDILKGYSNLLEDDKALWSTVIDCLSKSFAFDEGGKDMPLDENPDIRLKLTIFTSLLAR